ncbi:MAG: hypothetical protein KIT36_17485 [Alphaproteobacteria bacterium]|nr:hypothetical protein [Alphaproteobacteria bacterium]
MIGAVLTTAHHVTADRRISGIRCFGLSSFPIMIARYFVAASKNLPRLAESR